MTCVEITFLAFSTGCRQHFSAPAQTVQCRNWTNQPLDSADGRHSGVVVGLLGPISGGACAAIHPRYDRPGLLNYPYGAHDPTSETVRAVHTPYVVADESALPLGVRAMSMLAVHYLASQSR
jgi:hypothetical protein